MLRTQNRTPQQLTLANELAQTLNIDAEDILFLNERKPLEPWLNPEALTTIARQSDIFRNLDEGFQEHIPALDQVAHHATFIDRDGRTFGRSGVATIKKCEELGLDPHYIAAGRAISAALTSGGINPLRPGSAVSTAATSAEVDAQTRASDIKRAHKIARDKGLIIGSGPSADVTAYRKFLRESGLYQGEGVPTSAGFDQAKRASLIEALLAYDPDEFAELGEDQEGVAA